MTSSRFTRILAAAGASGALVAGGLAFGGSPASAASVPFTYNCQTPLSADPVPVQLAFDPAALPALPETWVAGVALPATVTPVLTLPAELTTAIHEYLGKDSIGGTVAATLGNSGIPIKFTVPDTAVVSGEPLEIPTPGTIGAPTQVGTKAVSLPASLNATLAEFTIPCTLASDNITIGSINIAQNSSTTTAKAVKATVKAAKKGKTKGLASAKVAATVMNAAYMDIKGVAASGKVVAKEGKKTLGTATLKSGKATLSIKKLKPGKHRIVVSYLGSAATKAGKAKAVTIKVTK